MTDTDACEHYIWPPGLCAVCRGPVTAQGEERKSDAFPARFPGKCGICSAAIAKGDTILKSANGYAHEGCAA